MSGFRCGIVTVAGRPNVGKSSLINALMGIKVAIVSDKPQTTRRHIRGILTTDDAQIVFTDTPGFHKPKTALGARLNSLVSDALEGSDVAILVVDGKAGVGKGDAFVYEQQIVPARSGARFCLVNKIDRLTPDELIPQLDAVAALGDFDEIIPVSAKSGQGLSILMDLLMQRLPEGPMLYPAEDFTDVADEVHLAELIREKALALVRDEVPHSVAAVVEEMEQDGELTRITASIIVERDSQKGILIGRQGETLKKIGTEARLEMEHILGGKVFLDLRVKVFKEWQRDPKALDRLGF